MSHDYKLNKSELTRLKRQERLYEHYLPVLKLKQEQLQLEQNRINQSLANAENDRKKDLELLSPFIPLFADEHEVALEKIMSVDRINTNEKNIAGVSIEVLESLTFTRLDLPYFHTASWLIKSLPLIKNYVQSEVHLKYLREENRLIRRELQKSTQKVNLFDKVLIPQTKSAIKHIKIVLGDEQVAMVTRGKIAKAKKLSEVHT